MTPSGNITTRFFCAEKVMRIWPPFSFAGFFLRIPKLIKGYHLLALIQIKNGEWSRAKENAQKSGKN